MADTKIMPFLFEAEMLVRSVNRQDQVWFVAKDVATALGYKDTTKAVQAHCKRVVEFGDIVPEGGRSAPLGGAKVGDSPTLLHGGMFKPAGADLHPQTKLIPESDVFRLILRSTLAAAQRFEVWLMEEVLPALRRTGTYGAANAAPAAAPQAAPSAPPGPSPINPRPWQERPIEERNQELRTIATVGRFGNHALAWWYLSEVARIAEFPRHLLPAWHQSNLDLPETPSPGRSGRGLH